MNLVPSPAWGGGVAFLFLTSAVGAGTITGRLLWSPNISRKIKAAQKQRKKRNARKSAENEIRASRFGTRHLPKSENEVK